MLGLNTIGKKIFGTPNDRKVKKVQSLVTKINALEPEFKALEDSGILAKTEEFKTRLEDGESLESLLPEAFANAREAAVRTLGLRPFDVQLVGGIFLHHGDIAEMKTGEGKTLMATLPVYLNALTGRGVHVVTVNDYLAKRDAEWMDQVYSFLGMTTGVVYPNMDEAEKLRAYQADITYATNNELGFDYLRDNMKAELSQIAQRDHYFAIVDEVDSILIDEARTPLIISGPAEDRSELYVTVDKLIPTLIEEHYTIDEKARSAVLTDEGNEFVEEAFLKQGLIGQGQSLYDPESTTLVHHVNNALRAHMMFLRERDYIVKDGQVMLIDEFTGRMMDGRRLSDGLHQALEAKENVDIKPENMTLASVTFQNYFRLYDKLAGMTGTAQTEAAEFQEIYGLGVVEVPTNKPIVRIDEHDAIYRTTKEKYAAIVEEIAKAYLKGQPTLVGTTSIEKSEYLSTLMKDQNLLKTIAEKQRVHAAGMKDKKDKIKYNDWADDIAKLASQPNGIPHNILNARFHEQEAGIIANAGKPSAVTIATNMAGRGTDIQLGGNVDMQVLEAIEAAGDAADPTNIREEIIKSVAIDKQTALEAGGLFVLATERHESRRIDNQLRGRSGRQGDPGKSSFFLSLEYDLMRIFGSERLDKVLSTLGMSEGEAIIHPWVNKSLEKAQAKVEGRNFDIRKQLLKFDDVMNDQRKVIFEQRFEIMETDDLSDVVKDMRDEVIEDLVTEHIPPKSYPDTWDIEGLNEKIIEHVGIDKPIINWANEEGIDEDVLKDRIIKESDKFMAKKVVDFGTEQFRGIEKQILLQTIDKNWREHLITLEHLRSVVGFRGYANRDPLNEYKTESFELFQGMLDGLRTEVTGQLAHVRILSEEERNKIMQQMQAEAAAKEIGVSGVTNKPKEPLGGFSEETKSTRGNPGRNSPCTCGSGKKFKHCCGKL